MSLVNPSAKCKIGLPPCTAISTRNKSAPPAQVLEYLSCYTHRTAIGNERLRVISPTQVAFTVRANEHGGKGVKLGAARADLQMPEPHKQAKESALDFMARVARRDVQQCPCCQLGKLRSVAALQGQSHLATPGQRQMLPANLGSTMARVQAARRYDDTKKVVAKSSRAAII